MTVWVTSFCSLVEACCEEIWKGFLIFSLGFWTIVFGICVFPKSGMRSGMNGMIYSDFCAFASS